MTDVNKELLEMMAAMKQEIADLKAAAPVVAKPLDEKIEGHNKAMRELIDECKERLYMAYGCNISVTGDDGTPAPFHITHLFTIKVVEQVMWTVSNKCGQQYFWARQNEDRAILSLTKLSTVYGDSALPTKTMGIDTAAMYERSMSPQAQYEEAEQKVQFHAKEAMSHQILSLASFEIWEECVEQRREEHQESNSQRPFSAGNTPFNEASEQGYITWLEAEASKREVNTYKTNIAMIQTSHLEHCARILETRKAAAPKETEAPATE